MPWQAKKARLKTHNAQRYVSPRSQQMQHAAACNAGAGCMTRALLEEALQKYQSGDLNAAEAILVPMRDHPTALHLLGVLRVRQGRLQEAVELLARSVALQPHEAQSQFNFGKVLMGLGRQAEATEALRAASRLDPALID